MGYRRIVDIAKDVKKKLGSEGGTALRESRDGIYFPPLRVVYQKKLVMSSSKIYVIMILRGR